jgi:3-phenylpropionate/trans-cinnamate dioxygenase ferredoxin component
MAWVRLAALSELEAGAGNRVELSDDEAVALVRSDEAVYAVEDCCSHEEYPLSEGWVEDRQIECALHGSRFDLVTGHPDVPPAVSPVRVFAVRVDGDDVLVDLPEEWAELAAQMTDSNVQK